MTAFFAPPRACFCVGLLCASALAGCFAPQQKATHPPKKTLGETVINPYAKRVKYQPNRDVVFADFTLRYIGQTKIIPKQYPRGFIYYNFVVKSGKETQKVRWSSGTGAIGPQEFTVGGKTFWLELKIADKWGSLAEDELVISPAPVPPAPQKRLPPPPPLAPSYGQAVAFQQNPYLIFPDLTLRYVGTAQAASPSYPHGVFYNFIVYDPKGSESQQVIRQSSRAGKVAPLVFSVSKKSFRLEIKAADTSEASTADALVVSPAPTP